MSSEVSSATSTQPYQLPQGVKYDAEKDTYEDLRSSFTANRFYGTSLESIKETHQAALQEQEGNEVALWKKPLVFFGNAASNLFEGVVNLVKAVLPCFFSAKEPNDADKTEKKKEAVKES